MSIKKAFILGLLITFSNSYCQKFELGKVTIEELNEKKHSKDTSAVAAFLFKKAKTFFDYDVKNGFVARTEFSIRLKIYKKEGLKWANFEMPYYVGYENLDDDIISISKAFTYNVENGKVIKEEVSSEGKFKERINEFWQTKIITFPNVKVGSVIELKYVLKSQNLSELPVFQFQYKIPVNYAQYVTEIPGFYIYKGIKTGYVDITMDDKIEYKSQTFNEHYTTKTLHYQQIKTTYGVVNVPALIEEDYVSNINDYYGKIENELQVIQFPNQKPKQMATTWEDVAKSIYLEKEFGKELEKVDYFINDVKPLVLNLNSDNEKMLKIFEFIKSRMVWNGKYGYYTNKGVEVAYLEKTGNVAEINLMLVSILRMAGIDSNPVLISTRENGVALFPNRSKLNYVIASVTIDGKQLLLDATEKWSSINILPIRDLNQTGRLIKKDGLSSEVDLMPKMISNNFVNLIASISPDGEVNGNIREQYFHYCGSSFRNKYSNLSEESYLEKLENTHKGIQIKDYKIENKYDLDKQVIEIYSFKDNNSVEIIGDKMYFSPLLMFEKNENLFKQENRKYPVDFIFPKHDKYTIIINIPEGYVVESLPTESILNTEEKFIDFKFLVSKNVKQITVVMSLKTEVSIVSAENYTILKDFFRLYLSKQTEKIVLKKV
ncbi:protein of unknown function [Flavobacterium swingsii]|jgi:hypothetical protein|uniref:Uncharacterized protein n=1 Tax=Flavobacterium swingsii TaxID=498292 RepID=A0A1I0XSM5_9FLAO|nr:DUF3857 domain-containing protein [Flavobacterium swingsii]SFB04139.1 protein of unknown function [Flavobacterium swingsii]